MSSNRRRFGYVGHWVGSYTFNHGQGPPRPFTDDGDRSRNRFIRARPRRRQRRGCAAAHTARPHAAAAVRLALLVRVAKSAPARCAGRDPRRRRAGRVPGRAPALGFVRFALVVGRDLAVRHPDARCAQSPALAAPSGLGDPVDGRPRRGGAVDGGGPRRAGRAPRGGRAARSAAGFARRGQARDHRAGRRRTAFGAPGGRIAGGQPEHGVLAVAHGAHAAAQVAGAHPRDRESFGDGREGSA